MTIDYKPLHLSYKKWPDWIVTKPIIQSITTFFHVYAYDACNVSATKKGQSINENAQHDEVEPNLKKIPHRNGIWGLEANSM